MRLFRRRAPAWPPELERRKPENAGQREHRDRLHRERLAAIAEKAASDTQELKARIDRLDDLARWIELGKGA